jgi:hypothetical protein
MTLSEIDWKDRARQFCQRNGTLEVANIEAAMKEAASIVVECDTARIKTIRLELEAKRNKANAPQ